MFRKRKSHIYTTVLYLLIVMLCNSLNPIVPSFFIMLKDEVLKPASYKTPVQIIYCYLAVHFIPEQ
jgi:hypothetical protein